MKVYVQKVFVESSSRSGWDSYHDSYEKIFLEDSIEVLKAKVKSFVDLNTQTRYGDFGICLEDSKCKVSEIETYIKGE